MPQEWLWDTAEGGGLLRRCVKLMQIRLAEGCDKGLQRQGRLRDIKKIERWDWMNTWM